MRNLLRFLSVLPLVVGCGQGFSETLPDGGSPPSDGGSDDGGPPAEDGGCGPAEPSFACADPCGGYSDPVCVDGQWGCPSTAGGSCPVQVDGGGCEQGVPLPLCEGPCGGGPIPPVCTDNQWTCPVYNGIACPAPDAGQCAEPPPDCTKVWPSCDGAPVPPAACILGAWECPHETCPPNLPDAAPPFDSGPPQDGLFACGDEACDPHFSYCQITTGGAVLPDGGVSSGYQCISIPSSCGTTPASASCACVQAVEGIGCGCVNGPDAQVIVTCDVP